MFSKVGRFAYGELYIIVDQLTIGGIESIV